MRAVFLIPSLPAAEPIAEYARRLDAVVATEPPADEVDVAIATDWSTTARLFEARAQRYVLWVDHFAHRRMGTWQAERFAAQLAYDLPVDFIAAAPWVRDTLADLRPDARTILVTTPAPGPGGVRPLESTPLKGSDPLRPAAGDAEARPLRVHLAGEGERAAVEALESAVEVVALEEAEVVVMLSTVDGVLDAPLRGFRAGATAVVGPAHDAQDLVVHGENGFVADADDVRGAARYLDQLARDRELLARLREAARAAGERWPSWDEAEAQLRDALERIVAEDPPAQAQWPVRLMGDAVGGAAVFRQEIATLTAEVHRVQSEDAYRVAVQVRQRLSPLKRVLGAARRRLRPR